MSFDFFNPSNLAFGSKLTAAFTQLNNLADAAEENLEKVRLIQETLGQYDRKNYIVPKPSKPVSPCRTNELFDLLNDVSVIINRLEFTDNKLYVDINMFNRTNNRITKGTGSTTLTKGHCYVKTATSNQKPNRELSFDKELRFDLGEELFQFEIDDSGNIILLGNLNNICCFPSNGNVYTSISKGENLSFTNGVYTATNYECVCLVGYLNNIQVILNGRVILQGYGSKMKRHCILYLKPNDEIRGSIESGFRINYNS